MKHHKNTKVFNFSKKLFQGHGRYVFLQSPNRNHYPGFSLGCMAVSDFIYSTTIYVLPVMESSGLPLAVGKFSKDFAMLKSQVTRIVSRCWYCYRY